MRVVRYLLQSALGLDSLSRGLFRCQVDWLKRVGLVVCGVLFLWIPYDVEADVLSDLPKMGLPGVIWEVSVVESEGIESALRRGVAAYEASVGEQLMPAARGRVGLKVNTRSGRGLSTPLEVVRAWIGILEERGYEREQIWIVDYSTHGLQQAGYLPFRSDLPALFEGCPVLALDSDKYYEDAWFYDSPLPPAYQQEPDLADVLGDTSGGDLAQGARGRKSFLPAPLLLDVDFWVNLPMVADDPALGVDGVLANATLWNVSNNRRFLANAATASAAIAEIAAVPELQERMVLHMVSLERYQYIGGPRFNANYSSSEALIWLGSDPVALDRMFFERMNEMRLLQGFPMIDPLPRFLPFALSLGLGVLDVERIEFRSVPGSDSERLKVAE